MAQRRQKHLADDVKQLSEMLDAVEHLLDRTKVMYEQYFMGIQKTPPSQLHRDIERKIRELTQRQIRNTAMRYRLTNVTQKFGVYNTYWRRILREIEQGRYVRDVARAQRRARRMGEDIPDEILASMPRRMRDRVLRDRERLARQNARKESSGDGAGAREVRSQRPHAHRIDANLLEEEGMGMGEDFDAMFQQLTREAEQAIDARATRAAPSTPASASSQKSRLSARSSARAATPPPLPAGARNDKPGRQSPASRRTARPADLPPGMTEAKTRALYQRYLAARKQVGKSENVPYKELVATLKRQAPTLMKQHQAKAVEFDIAVKGGKVILKAMPKR